MVENFLVSSKFSVNKMETNSKHTFYLQMPIDVNIKNGIRWFGMFVYPKLLKVLRMRLIDKDVEDFMINVVEQTLELREKNKIVRKDFFQLLVQLRNNGTVQLDDQWETVITNDNCKQISVKELAAHAYLFYIAGFETTSATMSYCLYEMANNQEIQRKAQEEIDAVLERNGGKMTYESLNEMKYLECCIDGKRHIELSIAINNR